MKPQLKPIEGFDLASNEESGMPEYTVTLVPPNFVNSVWKDAERLLQGGVDKSKERWNIEYLYQSLMTGDQQLWVAFDDDQEITSVLTTQFIPYPTKLSLAVQFAGGIENQTKTSIFTCVLNKLEQYAQETGCDCVEFWGRKGFSQWMKKAGYEETAVFYEKDIDNGR